MISFQSYHALLPLYDNTKLIDVKLFNETWFQTFLLQSVLPIKRCIFTSINDHDSNIRLTSIFVLFKNQDNNLNFSLASMIGPHL